MNILFTYAKPALKGGLLYNRPVLNDPREVAPINWRVATLADFQNLIAFYSGEALAGGNLKILEKWTAPNTGAAPGSLFAALPAGTRDTLGAFEGILLKTVFWIK